MDLGLSKEEFWSLTPAEFFAMKYRLDVKFRKDCFAAAIVAADYRNAHRTEDSQRVFSPFDFVVAEEMTKEEIEAEAKEQNEKAIASMVKNKVVKDR